MLDKEAVPDDTAALAIARDALKGGVSAIQLRDKVSRRPHELLPRAIRIKRLCARSKISCIINDRIEVALAAGADGLHVGQGDIPPSLARRLLGRHSTIGCSVRTARQARQALKRGADYVGAGPAVATPIKKSLRPLSMAALEEIRACGAPVIIIGGLNARTLGPFVAKGFRRVAVIRAVTHARRPGRAVRALIHAITQ